MIKFKKNKITIGVLIEQFDGGYQTLLIKGILDGVEKLGLNVIFFDCRPFKSTYSDDSHYNVIYHTFNPERLDGAIIIGNTLTKNYLLNNSEKLRLKEISIPFVSVCTEAEGIPSIISDSYTGMKSLVEHLIKVHDYKNIGFLKGNEYAQDTEIRYNAYCDALKENNISINPDIIYQGGYSYKSGIAMAETIIKSGKKLFDAIVFSNDESALAAISNLRSNGFEIPNDFALTGFDDIPDAGLNYPPLTTVRQPVFDQGILAVQLILEQINGKEVPLVNKMPVQLIIRESCGCSSIDSYLKPSLRADFKFTDKNTTDQPLFPEKLFFSAKDTIVKDIISENSTAGIYEKELSKAIGSIIDMVLFDLKNFRKQPLSLTIFNEWLQITLDWNYYYEIWQKVIVKLKVHFIEFITQPKMLIFIEDIINMMFESLLRWVRYEENRNYQNIHQLISNILLFIRQIHIEKEKNSIFQILESELKRININKAFISLYENEPLELEKALENEKVRLAMAFDETGGDLEKVRDRLYDKSMILPDEYVQNNSKNKLLLMELCYGNMHFGFFGIELSGFIPISYYLLRDQISVALYELAMRNRQEESDKKMKIYYEEIKKNKERYRDIAMMVPALVVETDKNLNIGFINQAANEFLQLEDINPESMNLKKFLMEGDYSKINAIIQSKENSVKDPDIQLFNLNKDKFLPVTNIDILYDLDKQILGLRWFALDILSLMNDKLSTGDELQKKFHISKREKEIIDLLIQGYKIKDIASKLFLAESTVKGYISNLYGKMGVSSKTEMIEKINEINASKSGYKNYSYMLLSRLLSKN